MFIQTCIFICINAFRCTKLWNQCRFTNAWTAKHINTIWINWSKWTWWIWYGWRLIWWHWTICQTVATWTLSPKWITSVDNSCCLCVRVYHDDDCKSWWWAEHKRKIKVKQKSIRNGIKNVLSFEAFHYWLFYTYFHMLWLWHKILPYVFGLLIYYIVIFAIRARSRFKSYIQNSWIKISESQPNSVVFY